MATQKQRFNMTEEFKQTEHGKVPVDWEDFAFSKVININPSRSLAKGTEAKYVSMADLKEFQRKIEHYEIREFKGGSKFRNGDTLMARITPCLENGKTAFVDILQDNEIGFGSTEFIVLSARNGVTDPRFVYYISLTREVRNAAIKSMTGTSGRQRVGNDVFDSVVINLPPLPNQRTIAKILSDLDEKIELNRQMNKTLESIAQAIFKHWFVDKVIDSNKDRASGKLGDLASLGDEIINPNEFRDELFDHYSIPSYDENRMPKIERGMQIKSNKYIVSCNAILLSKLNPRIPRVWLPHLDKIRRSICSTEFLVVIPKPNISREFIYCLFNSQPFREIFSSLVTGTSGSHQRVKPGDLLDIDISIPTTEVINRFSNLTRLLFSRIAENIQESCTLSRIRDSLLPKLMNGKIRVMNNNTLVEERKS